MQNHRYPLCYYCLLVSFLQNQLFISGDYLGSSIQTYCSSMHRINRMFPGHSIDGSPLLPLFPEVLNIDDGGAATVRAIIHWQYRTTLQENNFNQYSMNSVCYLYPKHRR